MANPIGKAKEGRGKSERTNKHWVAVPTIVDSIINEADLVLEILDARFIEKTRNIVMEKKVKKLGKNLIYVFNKSDLIDLQRGRAEVDTSKLKPYIFISTRDRKGAGFLKRMIKIEAGKIKKETVNVGIIGYPNTGKSSLINFLTGKSAARTSSEAGYTKGMQKVKLSKGLYLIDTPGIIPLYEKSKMSRELVAKHSQIGAITWDRVKDPDFVVAKMMSEYPGLIEKYYNIDAKGDSEMLISNLGKKFHYLIKGGEVDEIRTAKHILRDWQVGKIRV